VVAIKTTKVKWLVLRYLLFVIGERQVANNRMAEIVRCELGPDGPLAVISSKKMSRADIEKRKNKRLPLPPRVDRTDGAAASAITW
jgi:hypothetical protein